ncbi:hypothetical protein [Streptosporangium sp. NPDC003464]
MALSDGSGDVHGTGEIARHRRPAADGGHAYRPAGADQGPVIDVPHACVTGHGGTPPQAADPADRLTTAANGLWIPKHTAEWVGGLLAGVAAATGSPPLRTCCPVRPTWPGSSWPCSARS